MLHMFIGCADEHAVVCVTTAQNPECIRYVLIKALSALRLMRTAL